MGLFIGVHIYIRSRIYVIDVEMMRQSEVNLYLVVDFNIKFHA